MHNILQIFKQHAEIFIALFFLGLSIFYFTGAQIFLNNLKHVNPDAFLDGDIVTISDAIDGDEVKIRKDDGSHTIARFIGIQSNAVQSQWGGICFDYIKNNFVGSRAKLKLERPDTKTDHHNRLLAYLNIVNQEGTRDAGLELIKNGLSVVYTKYDFSEMPLYLDAEKNAAAQKIGLWGDEEAANRAKAFKRSWQKAREERNVKK